MKFRPWAAITSLFGLIAAAIAWLVNGHRGGDDAEQARDAALEAQRREHAADRARERAEIERDLERAREANRRERDEALDDVDDDLAGALDDALREIRKRGDDAT